MRTFSKKVDLRSRQGMIDFLTAHFRYNTMNSWNQSTSYAHNVKVHNLGFTREQEQKLYEMIETDEFYEYIRNLLSDFAVRHRYVWQVGFNGRNSGYLVLYQGYAKPSGYKSVCTECGQRNYKSVVESGNCKCGRCGANARIDYTTPPLEVGCYPGRNTDMGEDFEDWEVYQLRERVKVVCDFDKLCDDILIMVAGLIENYEVCEETVYRPEIIKRLCEVAS